MAELALDLDIATCLQLGILGIGGMDLTLGGELAEVLPLFVAPAYDAVAHRDGAPRLDPPPFDKAADDDVAADRDLHAGIDVAADNQSPFKGDVAMAGIHLFHAEHLVYLHARFFLTGQPGATGNQQIGIVRGEASAVPGTHRTVLAVLGGQILASHGKAGYPDRGRVTAHQLGARLDGDDGAEIPQIDPVMIQLPGFEDPLGRGFHQAFIAGVLTVDGGLAAGDDQFELTTGGGLPGRLDGGGEQRRAHSLLDLTKRDGLLQLFQRHILATPVSGDLGAGAHPIFFHHYGDSGILPFGDGNRVGGYGSGRVGE